MSRSRNSEENERGRPSREASISSNLSGVAFAQPSPAQETDPLLQSDGQRLESGSRDRRYQDLRRRRSSIALAIGSLAQAGGANSLENFARSWQRAVGFQEFTPSRGSYQYTDEGSDLLTRRVTGDEFSPQSHRSLLRQQLEAGGSGPEQAAESSDSIPQVGGTSTRKAVASDHTARKSSRTDPWAPTPLLSTSFSSVTGVREGYGTYVSLADRINEASRAHAERLYDEQQATGTQEPDKETEPLLVRAIEDDDGEVIVEVIGQSTFYQTVLNSINVLIGVGLLSLPLAIRYSGWLVGVLFLTFSYLSTGFTANLLGKCLSKHPGLITFVDLSYVSFGQKGRFGIGIMFNLELLAACVALFILFADSLDILVAGLGLLELKLICGLIMIPLSFVPFRFLGYTSLLGIICCLTIVLLVILSGLMKPEAPGSLIEPAATHLFPHDWMTLPLSFGLLMSPWGGHSVFPSIMRDMRHPERYKESLYVTFNFTYLIDLCMGVVGLLMFGDDVLDEVTSNILGTPGYSKSIKAILLICIGIIPITKLPLSMRPIFSTFEGLFGLGPREVSEVPGVPGMSPFARGTLRAVIRTGVVTVVTVVAISVPSFDRVMALLGSAFCFSICIVLPCCFYLRLIENIPRREKIICWLLIGSCSAMGAVGTVWAFLPAEVTGAQRPKPGAGG